MKPVSKWTISISIFILLICCQILFDRMIFSFKPNETIFYYLLLTPVFFCISILIYYIFSIRHKYQILSSLNKRYQDQVIDNMPIIAIQAFDLDGKIIEWNIASEKLFGYTKAETIGKKIQDLIFFDNISKKDIQNFIKNPFPIISESSNTTEWQLKGKNGKPVYVFSYLFPFFDENNNTKIYCFEIDITRLKETEDELVKSIESYVSLFENSMDGIFRTTKDGKFLTVNTALAKMLGYSNKEELLNIDIPKELYFSPKDRELTYNVKDRQTITYRLRSKDGNEVWIEENIRKIIDNEQIIYEGIVRDITARKQNLEEKERLYREVQLQKTIFEHTILFAPFGVSIIDSKTGKVYLHNLAFNRIFGIVRDKYYDKYSLWEDPNLTNDMIISFEHLRDTAEIVYLPEFTWDPNRFTDEDLLNNATKSATIRAVAFPFLDINETVSHFVLIIEDVTNQRNLEAQIRHAVKMESIGNLAGGIAHDFNNLLTGIIGNTSLALTKIKRDSTIYNYLINVERASKRAAELTKQLLSFSRKTKINLRPINLNSCVDEIILILKRTIDPKIQIERKTDSSLWPINADSGQIIQVIMNLCVNARDAILKDIQSGHSPKEEYKIVLETENTVITQEYCDSHFEGIPGDFVSLKISDNGCGINKNDQHKIFEPFYTTKENAEGTGLGLSIVYSIVKQHNGWINVYSEPDIGTTFKIYIPRIIDSIEEEDYEIKHIIRTGKETILLVDDEEIVRDLGAATLQSYGYKVITAKDGKEAIDMYKQKPEAFNLIILDYAMPVLNGAEVITHVHGINPNQKIILMSGYISEVQVISKLIHSVDAFIQKPYEPDVLLQTVRDILDKKN